MAAERKKSSTPAPGAHARPDALDTRALEAFVGYNARRVWLAVTEVFAERMAAHGLKQAEFSVLLLLRHNPGATSRQLSATLEILPPNLVSLVAAMEGRGLIERRPHPHDGRAIGLHLTEAGSRLVREAERAVEGAEDQVSGHLSPHERLTLNRLMRKVYRGGPRAG